MEAVILTVFTARALVIMSQKETVQFRNGGANIYRSGM